MFKKFLFFLFRIDNRRLRYFIIDLIIRFDGGEFYSTWLRKIMKEYYGVEVGLYSHGACLRPMQMDRYTKIGRYCSLTETARVMNRNHPMEYTSTHGFFFNPNLQHCKENKVEFIPLTIGNDVWMGHNAIIMPHVRVIGDGAVIGAGAVVNKDVPPYAVVVGNPARVVRYRFPQDIIDQLLESKWWEKPIEELHDRISEFTNPLVEIEQEEK